ncbi:Response regulator receiver domain-containing protein [Planifilum fulgidum]|uniref:Response regulator receiver domain-containing protein n=1 Tax=Planifilum fulgidum TaxID=201973 RepID=A0A1I2MG44_9BACL|nr:response regulator [Planifilum fulgidum]SFF88497.1 Response regulator receiver domain-containing protein [Planifilum fulgidum]
MELKMIIVDDEPVICKGLRLTIPWHELGVRVVGEAHNGKQALRLAEKHDVDLVLTDVKMPEMDGLALAEALRRERPQVRIVMISGYDEFEYARQALRLGVEDYLLKPVDIDELWQLVKRLAHERRKELDEEREEQKEALTRWVMSQILSLPAPETGRKERYFRRVRGFWLCVSQLDAYAELERQLTETERKDLENKWQRLVIKELSGAGLT